MTLDAFLTQVNNHFPIPMDLLCKKEDQLSCVATIQPDGVFSVPLILAHKAALYLRPAGFGCVYFTVICALKMTAAINSWDNMIELVYFIGYVPLTFANIETFIFLA